MLAVILNNLVGRTTNASTENITALRKQIDEIDMSILEILAKRMRISREIGQYKKEHDMAILQSKRYDEIISKRVADGKTMSMGEDFLNTIFEAIHAESVRQQMEIMNK